MSNTVLLKSWYAQNAIVPVDRDCAIPPPRLVASKPRARDNDKQIHSHSVGSHQGSSISVGKGQSLRTNHVNSRPLGHGEPGRKELVVAGNPAMRAQSRFLPTNLPLSVQCEAEYEPPMSQLSYAEDWSGVGSYASQSGKPHGHYSQSDSKSSSSRGVHPFNKNRSATVSSNSTFFPRMTSNQTTVSSNCASFQPIRGEQRHPITPAPFVPAQTPVAHHPLNHTTGLIGDRSQGFHSSSKTLLDSKSLSTNSYCCVHRDFSQTSASGSDAQYPGVVVPNPYQELIDSRIKAILKETFQDEKKDFDENQRFLYRRISEAEDCQADCIREIDQKHKECMVQMKELGEKVSSFDRLVTLASNAHAKCIVEIDLKAKHLDSSASHIADMHVKVVGLLKSAESSAVALKNLAEASIAAVFQAKDTMIQSTLPCIKQTISDMASVVVKDLGFNFQSTAANTSMVAFADISKAPNSIISVKENCPPAVNNSQDSSNTGTKNKPKRVVQNVHKFCKLSPGVIQPSQTFSPVVAPMGGDHIPQVPKSSTSSAYTSRSCVTPCPKERHDFTGHIISDACTPVKKRTMVIRNVHAKRQRSRFGQSRSLHIDSEEAYSFLSN